MNDLASDYPWTRAPLIAVGPMRLICLAPLAIEVSKAGGLGFIGAGDDVAALESLLDHAAALQARSPCLQGVREVLPVGVGFLLWGADRREAMILIARYRPAAIWLFAPRRAEQLREWTEATRQATGGKTKVWIQVGTVADAVEATKLCLPDVLVVQGTDAGGHGLDAGCGLLPLVPEVDDAVSSLAQQSGFRKPALVAAGAISEGRTAAAALTLGAGGICMGTRYLATPEANIAKGYQRAVLSASDGGVTTARGKLYDTLRGTTKWPQHYGGRGVLNESWHDARRGMSVEENKKLYDEALKSGDDGFGEKGRLTAYAGAGVGLVKEVKSAGDVTREVRDDALRVLRQNASLL